MQLVLLCCRQPDGRELDLALQDLPQEIDWNLLEAIVVRHRVAPLVGTALLRSGARVPPAFRERLARLGGEAIQRALHLARETVRLRQLLHENGIEAIFFKGATLAVLAYGSAGLKQSFDIDILVKPEEAVAVRRLFYAQGYSDYRLAGLGDAAFARFLRHSKEATFVHASSQTYVDLHWRLSDSQHLIPGASDTYPLQEVPIGGVPVRTLSDEALYAYLAVHGAAHCWSRLKWLADVHGFLARRSPDEIEALHLAACKTGASRVSGVALLLCRKLFDLDLPARLVAEMENEKAVRSLVALSLRVIMHGGGASEAKAGFYTAIGRRMIRGRFLLAPGWAFAWEQFRLLVSNAGDQARVPLPGFLSWPLVRLPMVVARKLRLAFGKLLGRSTRGAA